MIFLIYPDDGFHPDRNTSVWAYGIWVGIWDWDGRMGLGWGLGGRGVGLGFRGWDMGGKYKMEYKCY